MMREVFKKIEQGIRDDLTTVLSSKLESYYKNLVAIHQRMDGIEKKFNNEVADLNNRLKYLEEQIEEQEKAIPND